MCTCRYYWPLVWQQQPRAINGVGPWLFVCAKRSQILVPLRMGKQGCVAACAVSGVAPCGGCVQVYTPQRWQAQTALVDLWLQHPNGTRLAQRFHAQEEEVTVNTNGPRVPTTHARLRAPLT